jgi:diaminopimelate epimerase
MRFVKYHGTGNDFILVDARTVERDWPALAQTLCRRHFGVGADGLIIALPSERAQARMRIFNPDGSEAEMCGNGIRCFARFLLEEGILSPDTRYLTVETLAGLQALEVQRRGGDFLVQVDMGEPRFSPPELPADLPLEGYPRIVDYPLEVAGRQIDITCVSMGNPHAVAFASEPLKDYPLLEVGPLVEHHPLFPKRVNFEIARVLDRGCLEVRVWERGAGPTLACGTGACAAVVAAHLHGWVDEAVEAVLPGGSLRIAWKSQGPVYLTGPAERVFTGEWEKP